MGYLGRSPPVAAVLVAFALGGCAGGSSSFGGFGFGSSQQEQVAVQPQAAPEIPASIRASEVIGRWGYASFHNPADRTRTEANARGQCSHPYVIGQGPTGGVMMYPADQSELTELRLKGSPGGKNYIGPAGAPGGSPQDQEIMSFDGRVMLLRYVDPEIAGRYGTGVYVRCAPGPAVAQQKKKK
jgi:hypothetical protein